MEGKKQIFPSFHLPLSMLDLFTYIFRLALVKERCACLTASIQINRASPHLSRLVSRVRTLLLAFQILNWLLQLGHIGFAESAIITLKYYKEKRGLKIFHQVSAHSTVPKPPFVRNTFKKSRRVRKLPLSNWYLEQGRRWQLNNATFNLSQCVMSDSTAAEDLWINSDREQGDQLSWMVLVSAWRTGESDGWRAFVGREVLQAPERVSAQPHHC